MRRWMAWAARLYPARWRERYGAEFCALLEDMQPRWQDLLDVIGGAIKMQMTTWTSYAKAAAIVGLAGAVVAGAASFVVSKRYVSSAVMQFSHRPYAPNAVSPDVSGILAQIVQEVLSRSSLAEIIQRPSLDLYRNERQRMPMEDVIEQMRSNIRILLLEARPQTADGAAAAFHISFAYPDKVKAQRVVRELVSKLTYSHIMLLHRAELDYVRQYLEVLDPASLPDKPIAPNRAAFVGCGLGVGLLLGLFAVLVRRRPKWTLRMAGFGLAGCVVGLACSFLIPPRYISTTVLHRIGPLDNPVSNAEMAGWLQEMQQQVLSRGSLADVIQRPSLNLYPKERTRKPLEDVVEEMRRKIRIQLVTPPTVRQGSAGPYFSIAFEYPDRYKAQAVVRTLVAKFAEQPIDAPPVKKVEVLDSPSFPETPVFPNRTVLTAVGLAFGLLIGALALRRRGLPRAAMC